MQDVPLIKAAVRYARHLLTILEDIHRFRRLLSGKKSLHSFAEAIYQDYDVPSLQHARSILTESAPELVRLMAETKGTGFDWTLSSVYRQLCDVVKEKIWSNRYLWEQLRSRPAPLSGSTMLAPANVKSKVEVEDDDDEEEEVPVARKRRRVEEPPTNTGMDDDEEIDNTASRRMLSSSNQVSSSRKRKQDTMASNRSIDKEDYGDDDDDDEPIRRTRSTRRRRQVTESSSEAEYRPSQKSSKQTPMPLSQPTKPLSKPSSSHNQHHPPTTSASMTATSANESWKPVWPRHLVIEEPLPQNRGASGSDDKKWICPIDACLHTVWMPNAFAGQLRIHEHFSDHAREMLASRMAVGAARSDDEEDEDGEGDHEGDDEGEGQSEEADRGVVMGGESSVEESGSEDDKGRRVEKEGRKKKEEQEAYLAFYSDDDDEEDTRAWD